MKECNSCGKCCIKYSNGGLSASVSDIELWQNLKPELNRYVQDGKIWMDPETGGQLALCPWLRKTPGKQHYTCAIYFDRPEDCRVYPTTLADMLNDECEMLEPKDIANTKQAQKALDKIISQSN